ncbi:hypothetical protein CB1_000689034 [Camelus ferus]|nr:hypothetical protein CB1_000689034 [Camelus ferus]
MLPHQSTSVTEDVELRALKVESPAQAGSAGAGKAEAVSLWAYKMPPGEGSGCLVDSNKKGLKKMQANNTKAVSAHAEAVKALVKTKGVKPKVPQGDN